MALDTYENLKATLVKWLSRPDLANDAGDFITLFESGVWPLLQGWEATASTNVTTTAGTATVALPSAVKTILAIARTDQAGALTQSSHDTIASISPTEQGAPLYYVGEGQSTVRLAPIPDSAYTLSVSYTGAIPKLSDSTATNWLLDNFPQLYLYGSLAHAKRYMQDVQADEVDAAYILQLNVVRDYINARKIAGSTTGWSERAIG